MRTKTTVAVVIALVGVIAFSVIGQEEPLPVVTPKANPDLAAIQLAEPTIVLAAEPIREYRTPTLADAARHNDYLTFDALYAAAKKRGEDVSQFDALHELWTYSITDPIGAFYGRDLYERLSRAYPGYASYIDELRIVDDRGTVFYPTSETRRFLLARAMEGRPAPRVLVAETKPAPPKVARRSSAAVERRPLPAAEPVPVVKTPVVKAPAVTTPAVTTPVVKTAAAIQTPVAEALPVVAPVVITPAATTHEGAAPVAPPAAAQAVSEPAAVPPQVPAPAPNRNITASRGILLMIIGLIGVGLLALVLRTPREPVSVVPQAPDNVEPLRKPQATSANDSRATGSHG